MMNVGMRSFYPIGVFRGVRPLSWSRMRRLVAAPSLAIVTAVTATAAAQAAVVTTDRICYLTTPHTTVTVRGTGFPAQRPYTVALDGSPLSGGAPTTDVNGAMQGAISPPALTDDEHERLFTIGVQTDDVSANTTFTVTRFAADFSPMRNVSPVSRVRFSVYGFGIARPNQDVFLHYVDPNGKLRLTLRLGRAQGQCGSIPRTAKRRLFPFDAPRHGKWRLQFDLSKTYIRGVPATADKPGSPFLFYTIGVNVKRTKT
jgi:hypothetical protein